VASSRRASSSMSEALNAKRQETASAVSQMRDRLRAMGILEKTTAQGRGPSVDSAPPPPVPAGGDEQFAPPPPPPSACPPTAVALAGGGEGEGDDSEEDTVGELEDDDAASTVSGQSAVEQVVNNYTQGSYFANSA
jgi:hypothetical protein